MPPKSPAASGKQQTQLKLWFHADKYVLKNELGEEV
jgi:hypothetical protein